MIQRESYMRQIRPFINGELVKVLTGIRRSGKSVMLELIQQELLASGIHPEQFIILNFEKMENSVLCTAETLHSEILKTESVTISPNTLLAWTNWILAGTESSTGTFGTF